MIYLLAIPNCFVVGSELSDIYVVVSSNCDV
jgi:hypothetical protein